MKPVERPEANGTCWHACTCKAGQCGYDSATCAAFTCDASSTARLRVAANGQGCVMDECSEVWKMSLSYVVT